MAARWHTRRAERARRSYAIWVTRRSGTVGRRGPRGRSLDVLAARTWGTEAVVTCQPGRADWLAAVAFLRPCAASGRAQPATLTPTPLPVLPSSLCAAAPPRVLPSSAGGAFPVT